MKIIMLGAPGAGKGTQAKKISGKYNIPHVSTGDLFRFHISHKTKLGELAKSYMDEGQLVPDEVTAQLLMDRIEKEDCRDGYVLDGFPRTIPQANLLDEKLKEKSESIDMVIDIEVVDDQIVERMSGRRACLGCGATYHVKNNPPKKDDVCDQCGETLVCREDDVPETVQKRLDVYHQQTQPLISYYEKQNVLQKVDGMQPMEAVFEQIVKILDQAARK